MIFSSSLGTSEAGKKQTISIFIQKSSPVQAGMQVLHVASIKPGKIRMQDGIVRVKRLEPPSDAP